MAESFLKQAHDVLEAVFGYTEFRNQQQSIIEHLISGGDALVLMPTGGGKSLCYQIPGLVRPGVAVVVSPLIALMEDQVSTLVQLGVKAAVLNSTLSAMEARDVEQAMLNNELDLVYIAPERLLLPRTLDLLGRTDLALFAIDEAHCVSQWGHDFRPEYMQLSVLQERFAEVPRIALTATADEPTRKEIIQRLGLEQAETFLTSFDRPNIQYRITEKNNSKNQLLRFIKFEHPADAGIVYCLSRKKVESVAQWLKQQGLDALPYHAGLSSELRYEHQKRFLQEEGVIMVATIAFGMGIDKPNVRFVAHLDLPKSIEAYYQETGRAGRDGLPATAWMSYGLQDIVTLQQMLESSDAPETRKRVERQKLDAMLGLCEVTSCRRQVLLSYFNEHLAERCGNCDNCKTDVKTWDGTQAARKALSCVYRTGQSYGVNYIVDVLLGKDNERIRRMGHHQLSTYAIGKEYEAKQWRGIFRQLVAQGFLNVDISGYGALKLNEKCRPLLRGEQSIFFRTLAKTTARASAGKEVQRFRTQQQEELWEALRKLRRDIAEEQGVPPYVIFHDATLMEMVTYQPETHDQMSQISGVGSRKLELYADAFIDVIQLHIEKNAEGEDSSVESLQFHQLGMDVETIARQRNLNVATVYAHLAQAIERGDLELKEVVRLTDKEKTYLESLLLAEISADNPVKAVFQQVDKAYDYNVIRCVYASLLNEQKLRQVS